MKERRDMTIEKSFAENGPKRSNDVDRDQDG